MIKAILSAFRQTKQLPALRKEAELAFERGEYSKTLELCDNALALKNAFAPDTEYIMFLKVSAFIRSGNSDSALAIWKEILNRSICEIPPELLYPVLAPLLPSLSLLIYTGLLKQGRTGYNYYILLRSKEAGLYSMYTNSDFIKSSAEFTMKYTADVIFNATGIRSFSVAAFYESSSDGSNSGELLCRKNYNY